MVRKLLTAIDEYVARHWCVVREVTFGISQRRELAALEQIRRTETAVTPQYRFLNVQRLMMIMQIRRIAWLIPYLTPEESLAQMDKWLPPPLEEEIALRKHLIPLRELEEERALRRDVTRIEEVREITRLLKLHKPSISVIEQEAFADLETTLFKLYPLQMEQIIKQIIHMCTAKQLYLDPIIGLETLQKFLLQLYVPMYMEMPMKLNMIALRLTQLTMEYVKGMSGTLYRALSSTAQAIKTKALLSTTQRRRLETKALSSGKTRIEQFQTKGEGGTTPSLSPTDKIGMGKGLTGTELAVLSVALAYGLPYFVKRWFTRSIGLPENSKLYHKPYISFIPVRRTLSRRYRRFKEADAWLTFNRDEYLKNMRKWRNRHG